MKMWFVQQCWKTGGSFFSGASVDIAVVFWEDKKLWKLLVISQIEQFACQCKESQPQKLLVPSAFMQSYYYNKDIGIVSQNFLKKFS